MSEGEAMTGAGTQSPAVRLLSDPIFLAVVATLALSALFLALPQLDLAVSRLFYDPGRGFFLASNRTLIAFRRSGDYAVIAIVTCLIISLGGKIARPQQRSVIAPNVTVFLLWTLILGPGLLINVLLKGEWGRPRPTLITAFGGPDPYVAVWRMTNYCVSNCSFAGGEASSAIWLTALSLVVPRRWRMPTAIVTGTYAALLSLNRIAFGGHFLSDVLLAWTLTLLVVAIVHRLVFVRPPKWLENAALEARMTRFGLRLRGRASVERSDDQGR
jgi:lipid A 4'-phosphatase